MFNTKICLARIAVILGAAIIVQTAPTSATAQTVPYTVTFNVDFADLHNDVQEIKVHCSANFVEDLRRTAAFTQYRSGDLVLSVPASGIIQRELQTTVEVPVSESNLLHRVFCSYELGILNRWSSTPRIIYIQPNWTERNDVRLLDADVVRAIGRCTKSTHQTFAPGQTTGSNFDRPCDTP